ncbi:MAG: sugar ABC transporter permease [Candidatus Limiplasma sp.]|nr:sugar ABC transporter permease [Candidatus Limiplasma sp.]
MKGLQKDPAPGRKRLRSSFAKHEARWFYILVSPWIIGFIVFTAYPLFTSIFYSFTNWNLFEPWKFIGLRNYERLMGDSMFWRAVSNTFYYALIYVPLSMILSLLVAALLSQNIAGKRIFRTIFYIPTLIPVVVTALLFFRILAPEGGLVNQFLRLLGIGGREWFFSPAWSKPALVLMSLWGLGMPFILLLSGMKGIPTELYESARIDGSNRWIEFRHITLPMITPVLFYNLVMGIISSLQIFTQVYVIGLNPLMPGGSTGSGGGPDNSLLSIVQLLYIRGFRDYRMGYASAIAWILFIVTLIFTLLVFRSSTLWVYYEEDRK